MTVKIDGIAASAASVIAMAGTKVLISPVGMMMIHNPATIAWGDTAEMQKAIEMLGSVKDSIINAYEIKDWLVPCKALPSHGCGDMDGCPQGGGAWLCRRGFLGRADLPEDVEPPAVTMLYSKAAVVNSLMDKIAAKCATKPKQEPAGRSVDSLYERLDLLKS